MIFTTMAEIKIKTAIVFLLASCCLACFGLQDVCIVPDGGSQKPLPSLPSCKPPMITINQLCQDSGGISDATSVHFLDGTHKLNTTCQVQNVKNISLMSREGSNAVIQCSLYEDSGFRFFNVSMLKISGIEFTGCGALWYNNP